MSSACGSLCDGRIVQRERARARPAVAFEAPARRLVAVLAVAAAALVAAPGALAEDAAAWLARAAQAARQHNYVGTIVYQHGGRVETSRLVHLNDNGMEFEKLVNLDGPAREVIRSQGEVRCYYPDAKVVRIEPRTFRNAFPSLSPMQQKALGEFYTFRKAEAGRVAGVEAQAWVFEPKDGLRYGHKFWSDSATGLLLKARIIDETGEVVEQFAFTDLAIGVRVDREMVRPSWPPAPPDWVVRRWDPRTSSCATPAGRSVGCRRGSRRSSRATARCAAASSRSPTSSTRTAWSRSRCSSRTSGRLRTPPACRSAAAPTSSSVRPTTT